MRAPTPDSILPILVHIQTHLDGDLSLGTLARRAGSSPAHFHRQFRRQTGETLKRYTQRLRLEKAALHLGLHETTVLNTALEVGFQSHETFTRAFRRRYGFPPNQILRNGLGALKRTPGSASPEQLEPGPGYELSGCLIVTLKPMHLAFLRHVGPYEEVGDDIWTELAEWADRQSLSGPRVFVGVGHDAPGITAPSRLRFDAALRIETPVERHGRVGYQLLPGGRFAKATHVGHYSTVADAYSRMVREIENMKDVRFAGLPAIEVYRETTIRVDYRLNHTDLHLPVTTE